MTSRSRFWPLFGSTFFLYVFVILLPLSLVVSKASSVRLDKPQTPTAPLLHAIRSLSTKARRMALGNEGRFVPSKLLDLQREVVSLTNSLRNIARESRHHNLIEFPVSHEPSPIAADRAKEAKWRAQELLRIIPRRVSLALSEAGTQRVAQAKLQIRRAVDSARAELHATLAKNRMTVPSRGYPPTVLRSLDKLRQRITLAKASVMQQIERDARRRQLMDAVRLRSAADSYQSSRMAMISEKLQEMIGGPQLVRVMSGSGLNRVSKITPINSQSRQREELKAVTYAAGTSTPVMTPPALDLFSGEEAPRSQKAAPQDAPAANPKGVSQRSPVQQPTLSVPSTQPVMSVEEQLAASSNAVLVAHQEAQRLQSQLDHLLDLRPKVVGQENTHAATAITFPSPLSSSSSPPSYQGGVVPVREQAEAALAHRFSVRPSSARNQGDNLALHMQLLRQQQDELLRSILVMEQRLQSEVQEQSTLHHIDLDGRLDDDELAENVLHAASRNSFEDHLLENARKSEGSAAPVTAMGRMLAALKAKDDFEKRLNSTVTKLERKLGHVVAAVSSDLTGEQT